MNDRTTYSNAYFLLNLYNDLALITCLSFNDIHHMYLFIYLFILEEKRALLAMVIRNVTFVV
jgi:hypothetical protein